MVTIEVLIVKSGESHFRARDPTRATCYFCVNPGHWDPHSMACNSDNNKAFNHCGSVYLSVKYQYFSHRVICRLNELMHVKQMSVIHLTHCKSSINTSHYH